MSHVVSLFSPLLFPFLFRSVGSLSPASFLPFFSSSLPWSPQHPVPTFPLPPSPHCISFSFIFPSCPPFIFSSFLPCFAFLPSLHQVSSLYLFPSSSPPCPISPSGCIAYYLLLLLCLLFWRPPPGIGGRIVITEGNTVFGSEVFLGCYSEST